MWSIEGQRRYVTGAAHVDSGFVTLLAQDGVEGLQARAVDGAWIDVPPVDGTLAVNFGKLLQRWTGGRIKATEHRVLGAGPHALFDPVLLRASCRRRHRAPGRKAQARAFTPVSYGDHLWEAMTKFVEFRGMENLRQPRGPAAAA